MLSFLPFLITLHYLPGHGQAWSSRRPFQQRQWKHVQYVFRKTFYSVNLIISEDLREHLFDLLFSSFSFFVNLPCFYSIVFATGTWGKHYILSRKMAYR